MGSDYKGYCFLINSGHYEISLIDAINWYVNGDYSSQTYEDGPLREFVFSLLISFLSLFFKAETVVNIIVGITYLTYLCAFKRILHKWEDVSLAILITFSIYILYSPFNTLRQSLCVAIIVLGTTYVFSQQRSIGWLLLIIASTIHFTGIFAIAAILLSRVITIKPNVCRWCLIICSLLYLANYNFDFIVNMFSHNYAGRDIISTFNEKYTIYNPYIHYINFVLIAIGIRVFDIFYTDCNDEDKPFFTMWFIGLILYIILIGSPNVGRISEFFYVFMSIAIVKTLTTKIESERIYLTQWAFTYCALWQATYILRNWYGLQPYVINI